MNRPKSLVIHVGVHKTGTTAIQHFLWRHAADLEQCGLVYPLAGRPEGAANPFGHHEIPWSFSERGLYSPRELLPRVRDEIAAAPAPTAILSSEEFDRLGAREIAELAEALPFPTRVIFYYRRQSAIVQGIYGTDVAYADERRDIDSFAQTYDGALDFDAFAVKWADVYGRKNVIARAYAPRAFPDGNIVPDFLGALDLRGPPAGEGEVFHYNQSLPWHAVLSILRLRRMVLPAPLIAKVVNALEIVCRDERKSGGFWSPSRERAFDEQFVKSNAAFHAAFAPDQLPIVPATDEGDDAFIAERLGLWPEVERTLLAAVAYIDAAAGRDDSSS